MEFNLDILVFFFVLGSRLLIAASMASLETTANAALEKPRQNRHSEGRYNGGEQDEERWDRIASSVTVVKSSSVRIGI